MNRASILHRSFANQCYTLDNNRLKICISTGKDVEKVFITHGAPFSAGIMGGNELPTHMRNKGGFGKHRRESG